MASFIFLDRDGTIITDKDYLCDPNGIEFLPAVIAGLQRLQAAGFNLVILTNQSGVGRKKYSLETMHKVNQRLIEMLKAEDIKVNAIFYCPHAPEDNCQCRKPALGMFEQAKEQFDIDINTSYMIGDKDCDIELGQKAGLTTVLVRTGYGREHEKKTSPNIAVDDFGQASDWILKTINPAT